MSLNALTHLPYRLTARRDARAVAELLDTAEIDRTSPLGVELAELLQRQIMDWRDFFTARGVRMRRSTLMVLTGRSIADDAAAIARLDAVTGRHGRMLLRSFSMLIERLFDGDLWTPLASVPKAVGRQAPAGESAALIHFEPRPLRAPAEAQDFALAA
ncbi:MAG TPA: hypothetical protein VFW13_13310 [Phenylobacterium sp.]|nr:hypothetical protein [Phenylobacterium sp.]